MIARRVKGHSTLLKAVTFDFHDTLAACDAWFQIEIRDLVPSLLCWLSARDARQFSPTVHDQARAAYRALRLAVINDGIEKDALSCATEVLASLEIACDPDIVAAGIEGIMRDALRDLQPIAGAVDAVRALRERGIALGVVSSAVYHPFLEWSLSTFGILDAFDAIVTSASCGYYKSSPLIYHHAATRLEATPGECVHIGDSHRYDVEGARRAGMRTVWYARDGDMCAHHAADLMVYSLDGLAPLIIDHFSGTI
jgi:putative hydrolase of the HAD superfamily